MTLLDRYEEVVGHQEVRMLAPSGREAGWKAHSCMSILREPAGAWRKFSVGWSR